MILFKDWEITSIGGGIGRQYDNLTRVLEITGNIPDGWTWSALIKAGRNLNIIALSEVGNGCLTAILTAEMLACHGIYTLQLKAVNDDLVRHTNLTQFFVGESLSGDVQWPKVPSEFSQMEASIIDLANHPPTVVSGSEFWYLWDQTAKKYVESNIRLPTGQAESYNIGAGLKLDESTNTLSVDTAAAVEEDNTRPITSAAVYTTVGNIEILLETI